LCTCHDTFYHVFYVLFCHEFINVYIFYDLYFDDIDDDDDDDDDDNDDEHVGDIDAFSPEHSQYLAFFFDGGGLGGLGDKGRYPFRSIDFRCIYSFT